MRRRVLCLTASLIGASCQPGGGGTSSGTPATPVLNAVLLPGQHITFARPRASGFEVLPAASVILRLTSPFPLDGERVELKLMPLPGQNAPATQLSWVRSDDANRKQALAGAGYFETVVDGFGYSVVLTIPPAVRNSVGFKIWLQTTQGGTAANPQSRSSLLTVDILPRISRTLPSAVFFDCTENAGARVGNWYHTCKNSSSIVARDVALEGWVIGPAPNWYGGENDPIWVEDWHYDFGLDPDFVEQMYGPGGAFPALGDNTLTSSTTLVRGNPPQDGGGGMTLADRSATNQAIITVNSFLHPDNRANTNPTNSEPVMKAELNAWHVDDQGSPLCGQFLNLCRHWLARGPAPAGWISLPASAYPSTVDAAAITNAFWPYDPRVPNAAGTPLAAGAYVRLVGTLWQDTDHGDEEGRWTRYRKPFGGWLEIHPVDWIVESTPPTVPKTVRLVQAIHWTAQSDLAQSWTLTPSDAQSAGTVLRCRELVDSRFTHPASVRQHTTTIGASDVTVALTLHASTFTSHAGKASHTVLTPGRFKAAYILWWEAGAAETSCRAG